MTYLKEKTKKNIKYTFSMIIHKNVACSSSVPIRKIQAKRLHILTEDQLLRCILYQWFKIIDKRQYKIAKQVFPPSNAKTCK